MKKYFLYLPVLLLFSCTGTEPASDPASDKLTEENERLIRDAYSKDSTINIIAQSLNEIQDNLDAIKEREKILTVRSKDNELQQSEKDQILADLQAITELMEQNKKTISSLSGKLKKANLKIGELELMIQRMEKQLGEKDAEIIALQEELAKVNTALKNLFEEYNQRVEEVGVQTERLNTAFFAYGTFKELKEQGVVTKEGGFIGIGRAEKLKDDFNKNYFTKIDITLMQSIPLNCKKANIVTSHPSGSYRFEGEGKVDKLVITDADNFWSASKYLVVITE